MPSVVNTAIRMRTAEPPGADASGAGDFPLTIGAIVAPCALTSFRERIECRRPQAIIIAIVAPGHATNEH